MEWGQLITLIAMLLVSGFFASLIVQLGKRPGWAPWLKTIFAYVVSGLVGLATVWLIGDIPGLLASWGQLTATAVAAVATAAFGAASVFYAFLKSKGWFDRLGKT